MSAEDLKALGATTQSPGSHGSGDAKATKPQGKSGHPSGAGGPAGSSPQPQPPAPDPILVAACGGLVKAIGGIVTRRFKVDDLTAQEAGAVGEAAANVAAQYDLTKLDPKQAAWLGLGISVVGVALPRVEQYGRTIDGCPAPTEGATGVVQQSSAEPAVKPAARPRSKPKKTRSRSRPQKSDQAQAA